MSGRCVCLFASTCVTFSGWESAERWAAAALWLWGVWHQVNITPIFSRNGAAAAFCCSWGSEDLVWHRVPDLPWPQSLLASVQLPETCNKTSCLSHPQCFPIPLSVRLCITVWLSDSVLQSDSQTTSSHNEECLTWRNAPILGNTHPHRMITGSDVAWPDWNWTALKGNTYSDWVKEADNNIACFVGQCYATFVFSMVFPPWPVIGPNYRVEFSLWVSCNDLAILLLTLAWAAIVLSCDPQGSVTKYDP